MPSAVKTLLDPPCMAWRAMSLEGYCHPRVQGDSAEREQKRSYKKDTSEQGDADDSSLDIGDYPLSRCRASVSALGNCEGIGAIDGSF